MSYRRFFHSNRILLIAQACPITGRLNMTQWYVAKDGKRLGPLTTEQVRESVRLGMLVSTDLVWRSGMADWEAAGSIKGLMAPSIPSSFDQSSSSSEANRHGPSPQAELSRAVPTHRAPAASAKRNYFSRHWQGELSLPTSYWVNGILLNVVLFIVASALNLAIDGSLEPKVIWASSVTIWTLIVGGTVWQVVGTWRSANQSPSRGGSHFWAGAAKVMMVLGVIASVGVIGNNAVPQLTEITKIAFGKDPIGKYSLRLLRGGSELEVSGGITFGLTDDVRRLVEASDVRTIHLNSYGGRVAEARALRELIQQRGFNTHSATGCSSACVIAFMAGSERSVDSGARLGFHRYAFPGVDDTEMKESIDIDRRDWQKLGVPASFVDKAFATPSSDMWTPSVQELRDARVITGVSSPGDVAVSGIKSDRASVEKLLLSIPIYVTVKRHEPEVFERVLIGTQRAAREGRSVEELTASTRAEIAGLMSKYIPSASDEAILELTGVLIATMRELQRTSVSDCLLYLSPRPNRAADLSRLPSELKKRDLAATVAVIQSGAGEQALPKGMFVDRDQARVAEILQRRFGSNLEIVADLSNPATDASKACEISATFYEEVVKLPPPRDVQLLRHLFSI